MIRLCGWALRYCARRWPELGAVLSVMLIKTGLDVLTPWPMKVLIDNVLYGHPLPPRLARVVEWLPGASTPANLVTWCALATVVVFLLGWAVGVASTFASIAFGQRMVYDLAIDLFGHLQRMSLRFHSRKSAGDLIRRVTTDCGSVSVIVKDALLPVVAAAFSLVAMFLVMWRMDWAMTLLAMSVLPFMVFVFRRYSEPMMTSSYAQQEAEGRMYDTVEQTLSAMPVVQAFGREEENDRRFRADTTAILSATLAATNVQIRFKILTSFATAAGTAGILYLGGWRTLDGAFTVGNMIVFLTYLGLLYAPLSTMMYTTSTIQNAAGSAWRVLEVLETDREVTDRPGAAPLPAVKGHLRLERVTFGYEPPRPVLRDVALEALPGQTIAIVGPTGAGKSTLVSLVPRFFDPWQGRVTIDGHDVRDVRLESLRRQVALVLQEPFLFPLSVAENIAYGRPDASRDEIEAAARAANAHHFIEKLPAGYDTVVGERGATLSGGERQRLSIARALLKDAPVLILDEPTSAIDAETEAMLLEALHRLIKGRTTLIIAHRLSTVRRADAIVVVEAGRVVETGSHDALLRRGGLYANLHALQFGGGGSGDGGSTGATGATT